MNNLASRVPGKSLASRGTKIDNIVLGPSGLPHSMRGDSDTAEKVPSAARVAEPAAIASETSSSVKENGDAEHLPPQHVLTDAHDDGAEEQA